MISYKIRFKRTKAKDYKSETKNFKSKEEFNKWYDKEIQDETYRKILDYKIINNSK